MNDAANCLRTLHRIHRQLTDLKGRLDRGPRRLRAQQNIVAGAQAAADSLRQEEKEAKIRSDQKQLSLKSGEAKIEDLKVKLNACKSNKEYQALREQIAAAEMANSVLADEILELMERIDDLSARLAEAQAAVAAAQKEADQVEAHVAEEAKSLEGDLSRLSAELKTEERDLPPDVADNYRRVVAAKGEDALAAVEGDACTVCCQHITANMASGLAMGRPIICKSCGALLYLPADQSAPAK